MNDKAEKTYSLIFKTGDSLESAVDTLDIRYDAPVKALFNKTPVLIREVDEDQVELLYRRTVDEKPAMGYLKLNNYKVLSKHITLPDESYVYEKGSEFDTQLKNSGI